MAMRIKINNSNRLSKIIEKTTGTKIFSSITGITTDSRECKAGDLYIAIVGGRSDGHKYINDVDSINASAALVHKKNADGKLNLQQILVDDTKKTLGEIARKWRDHFDVPIIAITGSNGKTSTKDLLYHLLKYEFNVHSTRGNYKETDNLKSYNYYGWTKIQGEKAIKKLNSYTIIRTRFFNKYKIKFNYAAVNIYTSSIEVRKLVKYLNRIIKKKFKGVLNVGGKRVSDFEKYNKYKKNIKPCDKSKIFNNLDLKLATDASLNLEKFNKLI